MFNFVCVLMCDQPSRATRVISMRTLCRYRAQPRLRQSPIRSPLGVQTKVNLEAGLSTERQQESRNAHLRGHVASSVNLSVDVEVRIPITTNNKSFQVSGGRNQSNSCCLCAVIDVISSELRKWRVVTALVKYKSNTACHAMNKPCIDSIVTFST